MESVDDALGLGGADLLAKGDIALEAREQRQHRDSLLIPLKSLIYINWLKSDLHSDSVWVSAASLGVHMLTRILSPNKNESFE